MLNQINSSELKREKTKLVLMNIYNLPPMPKVIMEIMKLLENKSTNVSELNKVISRDQSLVSKILLIANSPLYGLQRRVTSVEYAVLILGFAELKNIISVLSLIESFKNKTDRYLDQKDFWLHSFLVGSAAKKIADDMNLNNSNEAFIAGFLHDVGISVLHRFFHSNFVSICNMKESGTHNYNEAEIEILGMNHQEIGYYLVERWNFPEILCDILLHHHNPEEAANNKLTAIVHLADYMTTKLGIGSFSFDNDLKMSVDEMKILNISSEEELNILIEKYKGLFVQQAESVRYIV